MLQVQNDDQFDHFIDKYIHQSPSQLHYVLSEPQYKQKLYAILSSCDNSIPHDIIFLIFDYCGIGGKWVDMGVSTTCNIQKDMSESTLV